MSSASRSLVLLLVFVVITTQADEKVLRVASDPNNLPFSNEKREGFENKIAEIIAKDLGRKLEYEWRAQRRGFFRQTLKEGDCDIAMGAPAKFDMCLTTNPYYRSSYVFISRKDRGYDIRSLDDPQLKLKKIGVQVGVEGATPPALALARRGIVQNIVGFHLAGDYETPNPPSRIIDAVAKGDVDIAIAWGPLAGYFAKHQNGPTLAVVPLDEQRDGVLPMAWDISIGVRRSDPELRDRINQILIDRKTDIDRILDNYGVPIVPAESKNDEAEKK